MSSDVTKRALSAGIGVGALALLAPRASADTPFSSFTFPATGAPTARTMPDRLAETKNAKDFGARGDGSTDDTAAIQAAVNTRGVIFFPPGNYPVSAPISFATGPQPQYVRLLGHHAFINGNVNGYIFDRPAGEGHSGELIFFEGLSILNNVGGCIRLANSIGGGVHKCSLVGRRPLTLVNMTSASVRDTRLQSVAGGIASRSSIGIFSFGNQVTIDNCDIAGFYHGVRSQQGTLLRGCRIEMNHVGFVNGMTEDGGTWSSGCMIEGTSFEANDTGIWCISAGASVISGISIQGQPYAPQADERPGGGNSHYGLRVDGSHGLTVSSLSAAGYFDIAAISVGTPVRTTFIGVDADIVGSGVAWQLPANRTNLTFIQCNQP
jgi:hypothetical protein